jgi:hypothetical protein
MIKNIIPKIYLWSVMSIATFGSVACGDSHRKSACYDALIEAGKSRHEASDFCYGPRD